MKQTWVVDINDTTISRAKVAEDYDWPAQNTFIHFLWEDRSSELDHHVWEKALEAGLPQDVDEFILLLWW